MGDIESAFVEWLQCHSAHKETKAPEFRITQTYYLIYLPAVIAPCASGMLTIPGEEMHLIVAQLNMT